MSIRHAITYKLRTTYAYVYSGLDPDYDRNVQLKY